MIKFFKLNQSPLNLLLVFAFENTVYEGIKFRCIAIKGTRERLYVLTIIIYLPRITNDASAFTRIISSTVFFFFYLILNVQIILFANGALVFVGKEILKVRTNYIVLRSQDCKYLLLMVQ